MENKLITAVEKTYKDCVSIMKKKNADYAGNDDPYKNFRFAQLVGVSVERAILVRMSDKLARISNLVDKIEQVKDEKITDTLADLINYSAILKSYLENEK